jgi:hypothetical protein
MYTKIICLTEEDKKFLAEITKARPDMTEYYAKTIKVARRLEVMKGIKGWAKIFSVEKDIGPDLLEILVKDYGFNFSRLDDLENYIFTQNSKRRKKGLSV